MSRSHSQLKSQGPSLSTPTVQDIQKKFPRATKKGIKMLSQDIAAGNSELIKNNGTFDLNAISERPALRRELMPEKTSRALPSDASIHMLEDIAESFAPDVLSIASRGSMAAVAKPLQKTATPYKEWVQARNKLSSRFHRSSFFKNFFHSIGPHDLSTDEMLALADYEVSLPSDVLRVLWFHDIGQEHYNYWIRLFDEYAPKKKMMWWRNYNLRKRALTFVWKGYLSGDQDFIEKNKPTKAIVVLEVRADPDDNDVLFFDIYSEKDRNTPLSAEPSCRCHPLTSMEEDMYLKNIKTLLSGSFENRETTVEFAGLKSGCVRNHKHLYQKFYFTPALDLSQSQQAQLGRRVDIVRSKTPRKKSMNLVQDIVSDARISQYGYASNSGLRERTQWWYNKGQRLSQRDMKSLREVSSNYEIEPVKNAMFLESPYFERAMKKLLALGVDHDVLRKAVLMSFHHHKSVSYSKDRPFRNGEEVEFFYGGEYISDTIPTRTHFYLGKIIRSKKDGSLYDIRVHNRIFENVPAVDVYKTRHHALFLRNLEFLRKHGVYEKKEDLESLITFLKYNYLAPDEIYLTLVSYIVEKLHADQKQIDDMAMELLRIVPPKCLTLRYLLKKGARLQGKKYNFYLLEDKGPEYKCRNDLVLHAVKDPQDVYQETKRRNRQHFRDTPTAHIQEIWKESKETEKKRTKTWWRRWWDIFYAFFFGTEKQKKEMSVRDQEILEDGLRIVPYSVLHSALSTIPQQQQQQQQRSS